MNFGPALSGGKGKKMAPKKAVKKTSKAAFEKSGYDKDTKAAPEGSKADLKRDKAQMARFRKAATKKAKK